MKDTWSKEETALYEKILALDVTSRTATKSDEDLQLEKERSEQTKAEADELNKQIEEERMRIKSMRNE